MDSFRAISAAPAGEAAPARGLARHVTASDVDALARLAHADVNLVLVRRPALRRRVGPCRTFDEAHGAHFHGVVTRARPLVLGCGGLGSVPRDVVEDDARTLVATLTRLTGSRRAHVRLETVDDDACRRFHVDYVGLRAVVTYAGPGTEWVEEGGVVRQHLARPFATLAEANRATVPDRARVHRARPCDVLVMKGLAFPGNEETGAVHRSPPVRARGLRRLVLTVTAPPPPGAHTGR